MRAAMITPLTFVNNPLVAQEAELGKAAVRVFDTAVDMFPIIGGMQIVGGASRFGQFSATCWLRTMTQVRL